MKGLAALAVIAWFPSLSWIGGGRLGSYLATVEGNRAYARKEYGDAMKHYRAAQREDPTGGVPPYNLGTVLYRQRKYDKAIKSFEQAANSEETSLQAQAYYNIGNCRFRSNDLVKAIESYKKSLQLNPKDADTKFNLELARRKLKEMAQKQKKKQNQQQQQQSSGQAQQGKKQDGKKQQDQQDKGKQSSAEKKQAQAEQTKKGQPPQSKKTAMSAEDARRLLQAIAQQEKDTRKRASKMMQQPGEYPVDKDW